LKGSFLTGLVFLLSLLAIAYEVIEQSFRNASIDGDEVTSRVICDDAAGLAYQLTSASLRKRPVLRCREMMSWASSDIAAALFDDLVGAQEE
jgi:hypothetical protein